MSVLHRRPRAVLFAAALDCAVFCGAVVPLAAAPLALVAGRQVPQEVTTASPLLSALTVVLLVIGGFATLIATLRRPRLVLQRSDGAVIAPHTVPAHPNAGFGWGVGN